MIKRMNGIRREYGYPVLKDGNVIVVTEEEKANMLVKKFVKVHSCNNLSAEENRRRNCTINENVNLLEENVRNNDLLNSPFSLFELNNALGKSKNSSPGKDNISYIMVNKLSNSSKKVLLEFYNKIWEVGILPLAWKEAIIVPILKPGKDQSNPASYRPIALTSHICKIMERMVNERLSYFVEKRGYLSKCQSGFRKGRSTMDPLLCLEHEIRKGQVNKESVVAVFFDIEKAYDMMWKDGFLIKLKKMGINGSMFYWIKDFLQDRSIQVRIGQLSEKFFVENGTPQGSIVSPLFFSIVINDMFDNLESGMGFSLFADDGAIWKRGKNLKFIVKKIQEAISIIEDWSFKWGFKISIDKTKTLFFTRKKASENLKLQIYNHELERVREFKFLGLWLDEKLTWENHIQKVVNKCKRVLNVMRCLVGSEWGAERKALKSIYTGLIRSVFDYGSIVFGSASDTLLKKLDSIQYQALRLCTGAVRTTPTSALLIEMGEMPLNLRRLQLKSNYWCNLKGHDGNHPCQDILKSSWEKEKKKLNSFGWEIENVIKDFGLSGINISQTVPLSPVYPSLFHNNVVDLTLLEKRKGENISDPYLVQSYLDSKYYGYVQVFTDASKNSNSSNGVSFIVPEFKVKKCKRITDGVSVYTGEMMGIILALGWIEEVRPLRSIVCSDSSSSLYSLKNNHAISRPDLLLEIQLITYRIQAMGLLVIFTWIPSHIGLRGNELADKYAKLASKYSDIDILVPFSREEIKSIIKQKVKERWQRQWEEDRTGRWLYSIQRKVGAMRRTRNRKEETVISRLRF
uniref:Reverse transcriptase domain-containing protein n=1 Tax=Xiphophorus maculatus TaxID=8083 RepID=A0A3B5Q0T1_XIPMA